MHKYGFIFLLCTICMKVNAQDAVLPSGGDAEGITGGVSYSVGQVVYHNYFESNGSSAEGVQQAYEISVITDVPDSLSSQIDLTTYPNPVVEYFTLHLSPFYGDPIDFRILDASGKQVHHGRISTKSTMVDSRQWSSGQYLLQLATPVNQSIRIIKIH